MPPDSPPHWDSSASLPCHPTASSASSSPSRHPRGIHHDPAKDTPREGGSGLKEGKAPEHEGDDEDGPLEGRGDRHMQPTVEQVWHVSPDAISWPRRLFQ